MRGYERARSVLYLKNMTTQNEIVPAHGYSMKAFDAAKALFAHTLQNYSGQNFDRAQALANAITDNQRRGMSFDAALAAARADRGI